MKKLFAIAVATAMLGVTGTAFAADRLADDQMDTVSAGLLNRNNVSFVGIGNFVSNNAVSGPAVGIIAANTASAATATTTITNGVTVTQISGGLNL